MGGATESPPPPYMCVMTNAMPLCLYEYFNKVFCYLPTGNWVIQFYRSRSDADICVFMTFIDVVAPNKL